MLMQGSRKHSWRHCWLVFWLLLNHLAERMCSWAFRAASPHFPDRCQPYHRFLHGAQLPPELGSLAWVHYMRWARRSDGLAASRKLFIRSRKWPQCGWQVRAHHPARPPRTPDPHKHSACASKRSLRHMASAQLPGRHMSSLIVMLFPGCCTCRGGLQYNEEIGTLAVSLGLCLHPRYHMPAVSQI